MKHLISFREICYAFVAIVIGGALAQAQIVQTVRAQDSFETSSHVIYDVRVDGTVQASHQFKVKNLTPTTYLSQHSIRFSYPTLNNIRATTKGAAIEPEIKKEGSITSVSLKFDESVVGEGQTREFAVGYVTPDVAQVLGEVLEVRVPVMQETDAGTTNEVTITVPSQFGDAVRQVPKPDSVEKGFTATSYHYTNIQDKSISLQFGSEQYFSIQTTFPLINSAASPAYGQIALPPDTSYQRFEYRKLEPKPESMKIDEDGNWIATYLVPPSQELKVELEADVKLTLEPDPLVPVPEWRTEYMAERKYWELPETVFNEFFLDQSKEEIYKTVIEKLSYDTKRVESGELSSRAGAVGALENPQAAVCQEYADVLVAAWRRAGVPARRLNGFAYTTNQTTRPLSFDGTVLHAWVEYHDPAKNLWQPVDPTWEDTTGGVDYFSQFDLNHIVFSIYGSSSEEPYPAGSYADSQDKTALSVKLAKPFAAASPSLKAEFSPVTLGSIEIPGQHTLTITNESGRAWYDIDMSLTADGVAITPNSQRFTLLPFEKRTFTIAINSSLQSGIIQKEVQLRLIPKGQEALDTHVTLSAAPAIIKQISSFNLASPLGGAAFLMFIGAGSLLVFRRKRKAAVRWQSQKSKKASEQLSTIPTPYPANQTDGTSSKESGMETAEQRAGGIADRGGVNPVIPTPGKRIIKGR